MGNAYSLKHLIEEPDKPYGVFDESTALLDQGYGPCLYNWTLKSKGFKLAEKPVTGEDNLVKIFLSAITKYAQKNACGYRKLLKTHKVDGFDKLEMENKYNYLSYAAWGKRILNMAKGLKEFMKIPDDAYAKGEKLVVFAETQMDWMVAAFASWVIGIPIVTVYATLGAEGAAYAINQTEAKYVVADARLLKVLVTVVDKCPSITHIMTLGDEIDQGLITKASKGGSVKIEQIKNVLILGESIKVDPTEKSRNTPGSNYAVYMYTSGTTGAPKGVLITHANLVAMVATSERACSPLANVEKELGEQGVYIAYLPLAHIMELGVEIKLFQMGCVLCYGSPHTLTASGVKLKVPESLSDAELARPHMFVMAPAVLDKVYNNANKKIKEAGGLKTWIAESALQSGARRYEDGGIGANSFLNKIAMAKLQNLIGGRCVAVLSGSAPLAADIQIFCQTALCCPVRQGYGLTETCAASCVSEWCDNTPNQCGPPTPSTTIRLADWKDGGYAWSDKDRPEIGLPRGEVLIAGHMVCAKYFEGVPGKEDPAIVQKNKDDFVMLNGMKFFRSGDIGQITDNGCVQIIDRKKDLWKGPQGEYVALTKVEGILKLHPVIEIPMCYGKTGGNWPIAVICADKGQLVKFAADEGITGKSAEQLMTDAEVNKKLLASVKALCKANKLIAMEMPEKIVISPELWTPDNELLTTTMKLKRPQIVTFCKAGIDAAYAK